MIMADDYQYITMVWELMRYNPIYDKVQGHIYASLGVTSKEFWDFTFLIKNQDALK